MAEKENDIQGTKWSKTIMRGRLKGAQRHKLRKLLHMKYRPSELAEEIAVNIEWIYKIYIPLGCPHERDDKEYIWIVGAEFCEWYLEMYRTQKLAANEGYCVSCKRPVAIVDPEKHNKDGLIYLLSQCPDCGKTVAKILHQKRRSGK